MAGSWIAMQHSLITNPKVRKIHRATKGSSIHETIGRLTAVWWMADEHSDNGSYEGSIEDIDDTAECEGFGEAMVLVGWLSVEGDTITFPDFGDHNGKTTKRRLKESKRKGESRAKKGENTKLSAKRPHACGQSAEHKTKQNNTEQEEKSKSPAGAGYTPEFEAWWSSYPPRRGKRGNKGEAFTEWRRLSESQQEAVRAATANLAAAVSSDPSTLPKDAQRFLRPPNKSANADPAYVEWLNVDIPTKASSRPGNTGKIQGDPDIIGKLLERSIA